MPIEEIKNVEEQQQRANNSAASHLASHVWEMSALIDVLLGRPVRQSWMQLNPHLRRALRDYLKPVINGDVDTVFDRQEGTHR